MDRDIIVIWSDYDCTYVTLNGIEIKYGIERGYEVGEVLISLFDKLQHSYNKPIVVDIYTEDYFTEDENETFWNKIDEQDYEKPSQFFTEDELQVLYETKNVDKFMDKVKENLK